MKIPKLIDQITISEIQTKGPFPPLGFIYFDEASDNSIFSYGLYWEIGKEDREPIICSFDPDEGKLEPSFPSLDSFIQWHKKKQKEEDQFLVEGEFFFGNFNRAKLLNRRKKHEEAIKCLENSNNLFGEFADSWYLLNLQYWKIGNIESLTQKFPEILKSSWIFGSPLTKAISFMNEVIPKLNKTNDPIINLFNQLKFENSWQNGLNFNFDVLKEIIKQYHDLGEYESALKLMQNYGYTMMFQSKEIKSKFQFNLQEWELEFADYAKKYLHDRIYYG